MISFLVLFLHNNLWEVEVILIVKIEPDKTDAIYWNKFSLMIVLVLTYALP